jgi:hypothetical protein
LKFHLVDDAVGYVVQTLLIQLHAEETAKKMLEMPIGCRKTPSLTVSGRQLFP